MKLFSAQIYSERRSQLKKAVGSGLILLLGNDEAPMNYTDNTFRYRQDSNFLYFFGLNQPGLNAILDADSGEEIIFGNELTIDDIIWAGPQPSLNELSRKVGIYRTESPASLPAKLKDFKGKVHFLPPYRFDNKIKLNEWLDIPVSKLGEEASVLLIKSVVDLRSIKSAEEIAEMEEAVNITGEMHKAAIIATAEGKMEYEVVSRIYEKLHFYGAELSYPVIFSANGQTLHNHYHGNKLAAGRIVINDSGAENAMGYAGDITRTIPVNKTFSQKQKEIYELVLNMETSSIASLKPGIQYRDVHLAANRILLKGFSELGLVKGDVEEMLQLGVGGLFMPHGLGHMIGLDVHDMEDLGENHVGYREGLERSKQLGLKSLRLARELEAGFVLTVEPGIYFIPELIEQWKAEQKFTEFINYEKLEAYKDFGGVRIEDNVLITPDSFKILGNPIPKTVEEVEALRA